MTCVSAKTKRLSLSGILPTCIFCRNTRESKAQNGKGYEYACLEVAPTIVLCCSLVKGDVDIPSPQAAECYSAATSNRSLHPPRGRLEFGELDRRPSSSYSSNSASDRLRLVDVLLDKVTELRFEAVSCS